MILFKRFSLLFLLSLLVVSSAFAAKDKPSKKDKVVTITTPQGEIKLILFDETPKHKANFLKLAEEGFYNGTTFHRIIENFMIQGGDPNSKNESPNDDGAGTNGYTIPAEFNPELKHVKGAVAAARTENPAKESSGCQFYIVQNEFGTPFLDMNYTVFGQTIAGFEVIDAIAKQPKDYRDRPLADVKMTVKVEEMKKKDIAKKYGYQYPGFEVKTKDKKDKTEKKEKVKVKEENKIIDNTPLKIIADAPTKTSNEGDIEIKMVLEGGVYLVPVRINGLQEIDFIFDTGASETTIPRDVVSTMLRQKLINDDDVLEGKKFQLADGTIINSPRFIIRQIQIGNRIFENVEASVTSQTSTPLLGQNVLKNFSNVIQDNKRKVIILKD